MATIRKAVMVKLMNFFASTILVILFLVTHNAKAAEDTRQLIKMPPEAIKLIRADMMDHLLAMNEIIGYLATDNLDAAADVAETKMGVQSMGKHRGSGMGPGKFMPVGMRSMGMQMHQSASEFARVAKTGDVKRAYQAFQNVTTSCVSCHYSYRTH